jgi:hypothetical protein
MAAPEQLSLLDLAEAHPPARGIGRGVLPDGTFEPLIGNWLPASCKPAFLAPAGLCWRCDKRWLARVPDPDGPPGRLICMDCFTARFDHDAIFRTRDLVAEVEAWRTTQHATARRRSGTGRRTERPA